MERSRLSQWSVRLMCMMLLLMPITVWAFSLGKQIVDEAVDASDANTLRLEVRFLMPVNYLWHFPRTQKDEFLIAVQPVPGIAQVDIAQVEHIRIPKKLNNIITDLYYDGTRANNRFIVLQTSRMVKIHVNQASGTNSILITIEMAAPKPADCKKKTPKGAGHDQQK